MRVALFSVLAGLLALPVFAERVVPSDRVTSGVTIRAEATTNSARLGTLRVGEELPFVRNVPRWREVRLSRTQTGFVSKSWTWVEPDAVLTPAAAGALPARDVDELRIHFLPIGAGTCTVIECPGADGSR